MTTRNPFESPARAALAVLLLAAAMPGCGDRAAGAEAAADYAADMGDMDVEAERPRVQVDPCALLTNEEIAEQLFLTVQPSERSRWTTGEFDITTTEPDWGEARRCEYKFESRYAISSGPVWHSDFSVMVIRADAVYVPEHDRLPVPGAGPEIFRSQGERVWYVTKGAHAGVLTAFPGTHEGGEDAGRLVLLRRIAERLP